MIKEAFKRLYPEKELDYNTKLVYSGRFKDYNANAAKSVTTITVKMSKKWKKISKDIQIGLIQSLLVKFFKDYKRTFNMDLYDNFIKNIHIAVEKRVPHEMLLESFNRVNDKYFNGLIEMPNLSWGRDCVRKLGSYDFQCDEIKISSIFREADAELLDYVMYHEMLHKKHKYYTRSGRSYHHTAAFRKAEKEFEDQEEIEKRLAWLCRKKRTRRLFGF